ncbi:hypothetical protein [Mucisphaera sp.]|uniref:hypothetical protein n=1 Tax=Mucisphaera sp. TaxID=2913024 RepID=UPI003D143CF4
MKAESSRPGRINKAIFYLAAAFLFFCAFATITNRWYDYAANHLLLELGAEIALIHETSHGVLPHDLGLDDEVVMEDIWGQPLRLDRESRTVTSAGWDGTFDTWDDQHLAIDSIEP